MSRRTIPNVVLVTRAGVSLDPQDNALITWGLNGDVFARRFSPAGTPLEDVTLVNTTTNGPQGDASIAATANGDFVVVWDSNETGNDSNVFAQRFTTATPSAPLASASGLVFALDTAGAGPLAVLTAGQDSGRRVGSGRRR